MICSNDEDGEHCSVRKKRIWFLIVLGLTIGLGVGLGTRSRSRSSSSSSSSTPQRPAPRPYIHGVNFGGWLIVERWITNKSPIWDGVPDDIQTEFQLMQHLGAEVGAARFKQHRDGFITEQDFSDIVQLGLNTVRIPVGYWIREAEPSVQHASGSLQYLDLAMQWAQQHNLSVLVDIHGAKGSQNGHFNSGAVELNVAAWGSTDSVQDTLALVEFLVVRYSQQPAFAGLCLLNEPYEALDLTILQQYYLAAYELVRNKLKNQCTLVIAPRINEQSSHSPGNWQSFMNNTENFYNVLHEHHRYQIWGFDYMKTAQDLLHYVQTDLTNDIESWQGPPLLIGEWTLTAAQQLPLSAVDRRMYSTTQQQAFAHAAGAIYWTYKFYGEQNTTFEPWSYRSCSEHGFI